MVRSKLTKKKKSGGYMDMYAKSVEVQTKGCARYNEVRNEDPNGEFNKCECLDTSGNVVDAFEYPNGMFSCSMTEGLKILENKRNPFYRKFRELQDRVFFSKSTEFPLKVEQEFSDLLLKNQELSEEVSRFVIDYTLDPREHRGRVFYDTLIPDNMQTLLNNVQAIQEGIVMVANDPNLKFNDITKLLGELITRLQDQYTKLKKLQEKHGETLEKMDLMREAEMKKEKGINLIKTGDNKNSDRRRYNNYSGDITTLIEKQLNAFYKGLVGEEDVRKLKKFNRYVLSRLPGLLKDNKYSSKDIRSRISSEDSFIARKVVEYLFEENLEIVKLLNMEILTKFIRAYLRFYLKLIDKSEKDAKTTAIKYTARLLEDKLAIRDSTQWYESVKDLVQDLVQDDEVMLGIAGAIEAYLEGDTQNKTTKERSIF
jgi:hypothetical protein